MSGVIVSSVASRRCFVGNTPAAARNVLEDLGLVVFVAIVGINAGNALLAQLTGAAAVEIQSNVPWIGFPVGSAVSGILITLFGYFAMLLAQ
jgi:putative transport protein